VQDYEIFTRYDIDDKKKILNTLDDELKSAEQLKKNRSVGASTLRSVIASNLQSTQKTQQMRSNVQYYRLVARDYARDHREDEPEYKGANNSDCANFVSQCINEGGIPEDNTWYQGSVWWIRTGYWMQPNNLYEGVVTYLEDEDLFYESSSYATAFAGSILFVTSRSHVGLVTAGTGSEVYYADHSNVKKENGPETLLSSSNYLNNSKFYLPHSDIIMDY
jgi:hypothetical protein